MPLPPPPPRKHYMYRALTSVNYEATGNHKLMETYTLNFFSKLT